MVDSFVFVDAKRRIDINQCTHNLGAPTLCVKIHLLVLSSLLIQPALWYSFEIETFYTCRMVTLKFGQIPAISSLF